MNRIELSRAGIVQRVLSERVLVNRNCFSNVRLVGAVDVAYSGNIACAAMVTYDANAGSVRETSLVVTEVRAPYIPGYLFLREIGPMLAGFKSLAVKPDVVLVNGHGYSHPRRIGIASYFGLVASVPTIGVAKGLLVGEELCLDGPDSYLCFVADRAELIAVSVLGGRDKWFISAGHCITLSSALKVVVSILKRHEGYLYPMLLVDTLSKRCVKACVKKSHRTSD